MPLFVKIFSNIVISEVILFNVEVYETQGINDHILGFLIKRTFHMKLINLMDCFSFETFCSHNFNGDNQLYICMHSHIEIKLTCRANFCTCTLMSNFVVI